MASKNTVDAALDEHGRYKRDMSNLQGKYDELYEELQLLKASQPTNPTDISSSPKDVSSGGSHSAKVNWLEKEIYNHSHALRNLQDNWSYAMNTLQDYSYRLNNLEQYTRLLNLLIHGLTGIPTGEDSKGLAFSQWVADQINKLLPNLAEPITVQHIDVAHPLHTRSSTAKSCIIVRFVRRDIRNQLFYTKRNLKGSGVSFSEHLTTANLDLYNEARKLTNAITWTSQCKVFVKLGNIKKAVHCKRDIEQLKELRPMQAPVINHVIDQTTPASTSNKNTSDSDPSPEQYIADPKMFPTLSSTAGVDFSKTNNSSVTTKRGGKAGESSRGNGRGRGSKSPRGYARKPNFRT